MKKFRTKSEAPFKLKKNIRKWDKNTFHVSDSVRFYSKTKTAIDRRIFVQVTLPLFHAGTIRLNIFLKLSE